MTTPLMNGDAFVGTITQELFQSTPACAYPTALFLVMRRFCSNRRRDLCYNTDRAALAFCLMPTAATSMARLRGRTREAYVGASWRCVLLSMEVRMAESVYKVIELVGTSTDSWEKAAKTAVDRAAQSLRDLRVAEVVTQDLVITDGKVEAYRVKLKVSFKYEGTS